MTATRHQTSGDILLSGLARGDGVTDDTIALNLACAGGGRIVGKPGANYAISSPIVLPSNTVLDMRGCTITLLSGNAVNMLTNEHAGTGTQDENIRVIGGTWNRGANGAAGSPNGPVGSATGSHSLWFDTVKNLEISSLAVTSTAGKFAISGCSCDAVYVHDIDLDVHSDGVHFVGPMSGYTVERVSGTTGDDGVVAVSKKGSAYQAESRTHGAIDNVRFDGLDIVSEACIARISGEDLVSSVEISRITGTPSGQASVLIGGSDSDTTTAANITVRDVRASGHATAAVVVKDASVSESMILSGIVDLGTGATSAVWLQATATHVVIEAVNSSASSDIAVTDGTYGSIMVRHCRNVRDANVYILNTFTTSVAPTITDLKFIGCYRDGASYTGGMFNSSTAATNTSIVACRARRCDKAIRIGTGTASSIQIAASSLEGNDWALITGPGTLNIWADGSQLVNGVTTASTPTINSYTFGVAIEANLIAKTTNGLAFNVNAGLSCGEGPVVCNGTSWKHLYTGSTY